MPCVAEGCAHASVVLVHDSLPFAPGAGPFRIKGNAYLGALAYTKTHCELPTVLGKLKNPDTAAFLSQRFVVGGFYDVGPLATLAVAAALTAGRPHLTWLKEQGRDVADKDIGGVYRVLLALASPALVMRRLQRTASQYFDFVEVEVIEREDRWETIGSGIPEGAIHTYMATTEAYLVTALERAGAKGVRHRWLPPEPAGHKHGVAVLRVRREVAWG